MHPLRRRRECLLPAGLSPLLGRRLELRRVVAMTDKLEPSAAKAKAGRYRPVYDRDGITLYNADCLDVLPQIEADVVITDPPYNAGKNYGKMTNDKMPWPEWCAWWDGVLDLIPAPDVFAFMSQTAYRQYVRLGKREMDWSLVWNKPLALAATAMPFMPHWEPIAYWGPTRKRDGAFWGGDVLSYNVTKNVYGHPTEKPLNLMRDLVGRFEGVILDPFAGSGTTLHAARDLGKQAIGIEISEQYCEIIIKRLEHGMPVPQAQAVLL